jgi:hypothetical protein
VRQQTQSRHSSFQSKQVAEPKNLICRTELTTLLKLREEVLGQQWRKLREERSVGPIDLHTGKRKLRGKERKWEQKGSREEISNGEHVQIGLKKTNTYWIEFLSSRRNRRRASCLRVKRDAPLTILARLFWQSLILIKERRVPFRLVSVYLFSFSGMHNYVDASPFIRYGMPI